jgi:glycosyltransferase involved in cell wall biosynthesis
MKQKPSLSIVIPAYNEEATVAGVIEEVHTVIREMDVDYEIILVDDGSSDRTGEIGRTLALSIPNFRLISYFPSRHYGGALKAGFSASAKEFIVLFPSDGQFTFSEVSLLMMHLSDADIVSGYRADRRDPLFRIIVGRCWNSIVRILFGYLCRDINCGFKIFRRSILDRVRLRGDGATLDTELLAGAKVCGYRITDVKLTHLPRIAGRATGIDPRVILRAFRDLFIFKIRYTREMRHDKF